MAVKEIELEQEREEREKQAAFELSISKIEDVDNPQMDRTVDTKEILDSLKEDKPEKCPPPIFHMKVDAQLEWVKTKTRPRDQILFYINRPDAAYGDLNNKREVEMESSKTITEQIE